VGEVSFYRPLTSYVFWCEWKLFGDQEWWYGIPTFLAHALATVLAAGLAYRLAQRWRVRGPALAAILMAAMFTGMTREYRADVVAHVAGLWKNQPDSLAAACCFLALLAYLRAQDELRAWPGAAAAWYLAACCFKEIAVPLPLVCAALEVAPPQTAQKRRAIARAGAVGASGLCFLLLRRWAIGGTGYTYGSNTAWLRRSLLEFLGPFSAPIDSGYWPGCVTALFAVGVIALCWGTRTRWLRRRYGPASAAAAAVALLLLGAAIFSMAFQRAENPLLWSADNWETRVAVALLMSQNPIHASSASGVLFVAAAATALWRRARPVIWVAPLWTFAFLAPLALSPGPSHRYYLPQFGYLLFDALGWCALLAAASRVAQAEWSRGHAAQTAGDAAT
jgi:hypothetical protein